MTSNANSYSNYWPPVPRKNPTAFPKASNGPTPRQMKLATLPDTAATGLKEATLTNASGSLMKTRPKEFA